MIYSDLNKLFDSLFEGNQPSYYKTYRVLDSVKDSDNEISIEKDGAYISFEVPGFNKSNLTIELQGDSLIVKGERQVKENTKSTIKKFKVGFDVDPSTIEATCEDGILTVFIPNYKKQNENKKTIKIS